MVHYKQGNVLDAQAEALVNTVNEVGVMGKGVALMFRESFPESAKAYQAAAKAGAVRVGRIFVTEGDSLIEPKVHPAFSHEEALAPSIADRVDSRRSS